MTTCFKLGKQSGEVFLDFFFFFPPFFSYYLLKKKNLNIDYGDSFSSSV